MDRNLGLEYLYSTPLASLLKKESVTDIGYNGKEIFYLDNNVGRVKSNIAFNKDDARDFIRQIANICERQFSIASPTLNVTIGNYRINAMHQSIGRESGEQVVTFAIRIGSPKIRIFDDKDFLSDELKELFDVLTYSNQSIVIGGLPGTGKTELQKYLLTRLNKDQRVIVVDNVLELENVRDYINYDLTVWQYNENNQNVTLPILIKEALRNMPDWLILAEGRGKEMLDILNSAVTGLPIITTLHSYDVHSIPVRMARMVMMNEENARYEDILNDIKYHFRYFVYLKRGKDQNGKVKRYIESIVHLDSDGNEHIIYTNNLRKKKYGKIESRCASQLRIKKSQRTFVKCFLGDSYE